MSKFLALEWDDHELRVAIASQRGATAVLEQALAVALPARSDDNKPHDPATVAGVLREALAGESLRKVETLVVVGRPSIELKELSLPPAPDEDLPDMVRFQALRDFTQLSDDTPLDFIALPGQDADHRSVLAAAISHDLLSEIRSTCEQAGLELSHLVLRPCAAASLLRRHQPAAGQVRMFVDLLGDEVDLTVLDQDTPLLMRTTRLPGDASQPEFGRPVFLEIRRTIAAVQNKLHGRRVEQIWLCGDGPSQQTLAEMVKSELDLPTELFDPFTGFDKAGSMRERLPDHHSRFAPLLGMLADAAAGERHAIDFLDPQKRPAAKSRQREAAIAIACAAILLLMFVGWTWWRLKSLDDEIARLGASNRQLDKDLGKSKQIEKDAAELDAWMNRDVPWLDVLQRLSTQGPKAEVAMLTTLSAKVEKDGGGTMTMDVLATEATKVGDQLRRVHAKTKSTGIGSSDGKIKRYAHKFQAISTIDEKAIEVARNPMAKKDAASKAGAKKETVKKDAAKKDDNKATEVKDSTANRGDSKPADTTPAAAKTVEPKPADASPQPVAVEPAIQPAEVKTEETKTEAAPAAAPATTESPAETAPAYSDPQPSDAPSPTAPSSTEQPAVTTEEKTEG